jgi:hypothetical protein
MRSSPYPSLAGLLVDSFTGVGTDRRTHYAVLAPLVGCLRHVPQVWPQNNALLFLLYGVECLRRRRVSYALQLC